MKPWIDAVLTLQSDDMKIRAYKTKLSTIPIERKKLESERQTALSKVKDAKNAQIEKEKHLKELENRAASLDENIKKLLTQSAMVKKNTEYQAMMTDIENKKNEISDIETEELTLMDEIEAAKTVVTAAEHDLAVCERAVKSEIRDLAELEEEVLQAIKDVESLRAAHAEKVDPDVIDNYERLLKNDSGFPMGKVSTDGVCSCCGFKVTPQTFSNTKKGMVTYCDNCSHLLYYEP